jgi:hypothetical protein
MKKLFAVMVNVLFMFGTLAFAAPAPKVAVPVKPVVVTEKKVAPAKKVVKAKKVVAPVVVPVAK